jgi:hypothetical protein
VLARGATLAALQAGPWRLTYDGRHLEAHVCASADASALRSACRMWWSRL